MRGMVVLGTEGSQERTAGSLGRRFLFIESEKRDQEDEDSLGGAVESLIERRPTDGRVFFASGVAGGVVAVGRFEVPYNWLVPRQEASPAGERLGPLTDEQGRRVAESLYVSFGTSTSSALLDSVPFPNSALLRQGLQSSSGALTAEYNLGSVHALVAAHEMDNVAGLLVLRASPSQLSLSSSPELYKLISSFRVSPWPSRLP